MTISHPQQTSLTLVAPPRSERGLPEPEELSEPRHVPQGDRGTGQGADRREAVRCPLRPRDVREERVHRRRARYVPPPHPPCRARQGGGHRRLVVPGGEPPGGHRGAPPRDRRRRFGGVQADLRAVRPAQRKKYCCHYSRTCGISAL